MHGKVTFSRIAVCLVGVVLALTNGHAQQKPESAVAPFNPAVYRVGERLTYDVSFSQFVSAAHVEMFVAGHGRYFDREGIELRAHVETSGVVNVALLSLNNDYVTYVDAATGLPYRSQTVAREAGRTSEASSDYNQPAGTDAISGKRAGEIVGTYELLSAVYRLRAMPLSEGVSVSINVRNESQDYQADIKITGRQLIKSNVGSFNTLVARVSASSGPLSNIRVYLTEDEWHVPVLVTAKHKDGEIRAQLAASQLSATAPTATPSPQRVVPPSDRKALVPVPVPTTTPASATRLNLPFNVGEELNYRVFLGATTQAVGSATFSVAARGRYFNRDGLLLQATAQTTNAGARIFYVNDKISSYVDPETLLPFRTEMNFAEGTWRNTRGYNIDQDRGTVTTDTRTRIEIPVGTHDLISLLYAIRTFDLSPPSTALSQAKRNAISILAINQPRTLFVTSQKRETIELNGQNVPALLLTLSSDDGTADRLQLRLWVGDDWRHLPLRIAAVTPLGPVRADLTIRPTVNR